MGRLKEVSAEIEVLYNSCHGCGDPEFTSSDECPEVCSHCYREYEDEYGSFLKERELDIQATIARIARKMVEVRRSKV